jgi:signal transduction histidine kinase
VTGLETGRMRFYHRDYDFSRLVMQGLEEAKKRCAARGVRLVVDVPEAALPAYGDAERLSRAIGQLLDNAAKFASEGGAVGVAVATRAGTYELLVADTGPGIAAAHRERVFEPFYQVDGSPTRAHGGVGVGLAIARRVSRGLGGDLVIGAGATVDGVAFDGAALTLSVAQRAPLESSP